MEIKNDKGKKIQMPSIAQIIGAVKQRGLFSGFTRYQYMNYDIEEALQIVEAIGKSRNPKFVIDDENRFAYENFVRWAHCDTSMKCIDPITKEIVPGRPKCGIYIAGNTGTGKSWCLDIMRAYCSIMRFGIAFPDDIEPRKLYWSSYRADEICDKYVESGGISHLKKHNILGIQDFGSEPRESLYMGNRIDVIGQLIEHRGDQTDQITLITSNLKINGDMLIDRYGDKVSSRLIEMCNYFEIKGKDRRKI